MFNEIPFNRTMIRRVMLTACHIPEFRVAAHGLTVFAVEATHRLVPKVTGLRGYVNSRSRYRNV